VIGLVPGKKYNEIVFPILSPYPASHLRFGVEMHEKAWSTPRATIHWHPEISQLGMICAKMVEKITLRPLQKL
jgi:hypothetical protein